MIEKYDVLISLNNYAICYLLPPLYDWLYFVRINVFEIFILCTYL